MQSRVLTRHACDGHQADLQHLRDLLHKIVLSRLQTSGAGYYGALIKERRFEPSRSTGSKVFFLLTRLNANNCICLAKCPYSFRDDWPDLTKALPKNSRRQLPVDVRRSKTSFICFYYYIAGSASKQKIQDR